jgi:uncharacterized protein
LISADNTPVRVGHEAAGAPVEGRKGTIWPAKVTLLSNSAVQVEVDQVEAKAYVTISKDGGQLSVEDVVQALKSRNVPYWIDESAIQRTLDGQVFDQPVVVAGARDGKVTITIEKGEKEAHMVLEPAYGGRELEHDDIERAFAEKGVVLGIDREAADRAFFQKMYGTPIVVARSKDPVNGRDAVIEYLFKTDRSIHPKETEDGRIDYRDIEMVVSTKKGTVLARKLPATPGENGFTITGKTLFTRPGKDVRLVAGKNARVSEDGFELIADMDGQPLLREKVVAVEHVLTIEGDVDYRTGNIDFNGSIKIGGSIIPGFSLKATESIQIDGVVEEGFVEAGEDVVIKGGILGKQKGTVKAGGSVSALFIEQTSIEAGRKIITGESLHSTLVAGDEVILNKGEGRICGGKVTARNIITANTIGSESFVRTQLCVGFEPKEKELLEELRQEWMEKQVTWNGVEKNLATLEEYRLDGARWWAKHEDDYNRLQATRQQLQERLEELDEKINDLEEAVSKAAAPQVRAIKRIYPNVELRIKSFVKENQTELSCTVFFPEGALIQSKAYVF